MHSDTKNGVTMDVTRVNHVPVMGNIISRVPYVFCPKGVEVINRYEVGTPKETADVVFYTLVPGDGIKVHTSDDISSIHLVV